MLSLQLRGCGDVAGEKGCGDRFITLCIHVVIIFSASSKSANMQENHKFGILTGA